jgi:hypothetical protein
MKKAIKAKRSLLESGGSPKTPAEPASPQTKPDAANASANADGQGQQPTERNWHHVLIQIETELAQLDDEMAERDALVARLMEEIGG